MQPRVLRPGAKVTAFALLANLFLVPFVQAEETELARARQMIGVMQERGALDSSWLDQRKAMETLRQRVKDSRLDLNTNGVEFYRKKAKVMVDLERQRLRRAVRYLLDNSHGPRVAEELRKTGHSELVDLANNMQLATVNSRTQAEINSQAQSVTDEYLSYRMGGYEQVVTSMETQDLRKVMVDTEEAATEFIQSGGDMRALNRGIFARGNDEEGDDTGKSKVIRWLIGAIAGVGLIIAIFFSVSTMTITPFLTFMATVSGLLALLGRNSAFQSVFFGNPYGPTPGPFNPYNPWNPYWGNGQFPPGMGG